MTSKRAAAMLHRLVAKQVQTAVDGDHADGGGLQLQVRRGRGSWVFRYTSPAGRRREMGLGVCYRDSLAQAGDSLGLARDLAGDARALLNRGTDPIDYRDKTKTAQAEAVAATKAARKRDALTLARAARGYHERVVEPKRTPKHASQWISSLENHVPTGLWHAPIASITPPLLLDGLLKIVHHDRARNIKGTMPLETIGRIRQRLDAVFEDAMFRGECASNPAKAILRKLREHLPDKPAGKFAALPFKSAPALMHRIRATQGTAARCLEFAVLTAARTSEALDAQWSEIDLDDGLWIVPADRMKAGEPHAVFLPQRALEILRGQVGKDDRYVFPSPQVGREGKPMSNMALLAVLERLGMRGKTTVHGLCRSTFSTWANETAAARPDVIEAVLAHKEDDKVRAAYNRAEFNDERKALLAAWDDYLNQTANVLPLKTRKAA